MSHAEKHGPSPTSDVLSASDQVYLVATEGRCSSRSHAYLTIIEENNHPSFPPSLHYRTHCRAFVEQSTLEHQFLWLNLLSMVSPVVQSSSPVQ